MPGLRAILSAMILTAAALPVHALDDAQGAVVQQVRQVQLNDRGKSEFRDFRNSRGAYASFFAATDGATGAWRADHFSLKAAQDHARVSCEVRAPGRCVEVARIVPRNDTQRRMIPQRAQTTFRAETRRTASGNYAAFAINGLGGWGFASNIPDDAAARTRARLECEASSARDRAKHRAELRAAYDKAGFYRCAVIHIIQKR